MITINLIFIIVLCIVSVESILWSFTIYNHCAWAKNHHQEDERRHVSYSSLSIFSALSGIFSFLIWLCYVYFLTISSLYIFHVAMVFFMVLFFQIISCHTWHLISTYICIPIEFVPFISKNVIILSNKILTNGYQLNSIPLHQWESIFVKSSHHRQLALNFVDIIPFMVWTKDIDNRFTYANRAMCNGILNTPEEFVINKTSLEVADSMRKRGLTYTFGDLCFDSDEITKKRGKPTMFYEYGVAGSNYMILRVIKAPLFDGNNGLAGTIGMARDITYHAEVYDQIENLFETGDYESARSVFTAYKQKFESLQDEKEVEIIKKWII